MLTRREIVASLGWTKSLLEQHLAGEHLYPNDPLCAAVKHIAAFIADLSVPPTLPEGWEQAGRARLENEAMGREIEWRKDQLIISAGAICIYVPIAAVRAALELAEEGK